MEVDQVNKAQTFAYLNSQTSACVFNGPHQKGSFRGPNAQDLLHVGHKNSPVEKNLSPRLSLTDQILGFSLKKELPGFKQDNGTGLYSEAVLPVVMLGTPTFQVG